MEELIPNIRVALTQHRKYLLAMSLALFLMGYIVLGVSNAQIISAEQSFSTLASIRDDTQIPVSIPGKGTYHVNSTSGQVSFGEQPRMQVYNDKEKMVFSFPISGFPAKFEVDSTGQYVVVLENVTLALGTELIIYEITTKDNSSFPLSILNFPGKVIFVSGITSSVISFLMYLILQRKQNVEERAKLQSFIEISIFSRVSYFALSLMAGLAAVFGFITVTFPQVLVHAVAIWLVLAVLIAVYWIKITEIVGFFLSEFGYRGLLTMGRIINFSVFLIALFYIVFFASWTITDPTLRLLYGGVSFWIVIPCMVFLVLMIPFIAPLSVRGNAVLCLQEFLSDYDHNQKNADFGYIRNASKSIALILNGYNSLISSNVLSEYISREQLNYRGAGPTTQRIMESLEPFNGKKLADIIERIPNIKGKEPRSLTFDRVLEHLYYLVATVLSIVSVIVVLLRPIA